MTKKYKKKEANVFDTGAFVLYFGGDKRIKPYFDEVFRNEKQGVVCELILGEFWYKTCEKLGTKKAEDFLTRICTSNILIAEESKIYNRAAFFKCKYRDKFSFVDCHVLALAELTEGTIITTDSNFKDLKEFKVIYIEVK